MRPSFLTWVLVVLGTLNFSGCAHVRSAVPLNSTLVSEIRRSSKRGEMDRVILQNGQKWEDLGTDLRFIGEIHSAFGDHAVLFSGTGCSHCVEGPNLLVRSANGGKVFVLPFPDGPSGRKSTSTSSQELPEVPQQIWAFFGRCESSSEDIVLGYRIQPGDSAGVREVLKFGLSGLIDVRKVALREEVRKFRPPTGCTPVSSKLSSRN